MTEKDSRGLEAGKSGKLRDTLTAVAVIAFGGAVWAGAQSFPHLSIQGTIGPDFWPRMVAGGLIGFGIILLVMAVSGTTAPLEVDQVNPSQRLPMVLAFGIIVVYLFAWPRVGFLPTTIVAFLLLSRLFGIGKWWQALLWCMVLTLISWGLFKQLLGVPL